METERVQINGKHLVIRGAGSMCPPGITTDYMQYFCENKSERKKMTSDTNLSIKKKKTKSEVSDQY